MVDWSMLRISGDECNDRVLPMLGPDLQQTLMQQATNATAVSNLLL
jgi:hypothetical protein